VTGVHDDIVSIRMLRDAEGEFYPLTKNELVLICPQRSDLGYTEKLQAEVLRVRHGEADAQVFETTRGVAIGDAVEQTGQMLSVALGPGLLGQVYDGLQNPLELIASQHGFFLPRGLAVDGIDQQQKWSFQPVVKVGTRVKAGDLLGRVPEGKFIHKIMVPFNMRGEAEVSWVQEGSFTVATPVVRLRQANGEEREVSMQQFWPVRVPVNRDLLREGYDQHPPDRHLLPGGDGGHRLYPRPLWCRQDGVAGADFALLQRGYRGDRGLRRAGR
jgi:V/A-type H+-transporting ATPase subunit A